MRAQHAYKESETRSQSKRLNADQPRLKEVETLMLCLVGDSSPASLDARLRRLMTYAVAGLPVGGLFWAGLPHKLNPPEAMHPTVREFLASRAS